jgi:mRNA interferase HicA
MKRAQLLKHLREKECELLREGAKHSWWWHPGSGRRTAVPRHREIDNQPAAKICKDPGIADWA